MCYTENMANLCLIIGLFVLGVLWAACGVWVYKHSQKRGCLVSAAVAVCFILALSCGGMAAQRVMARAPAECFGVLLGGLGGALWLRERRFFKRAIIVSGVVTDYKKLEPRQERFRKQAVSHGFQTSGEEVVSLGARREEPPMYAPVVQFEFDGQTRRITGTVYSSSKPKMGAVVKVGVDPQNIEDARLRSEFPFGLIFFVAGLLLLVVAVFMRLAGSY